MAHEARLPRRTLLNLLTMEPAVHPFRAAVDAGDHDAIEALLAEDVVFTSPVAFKPYSGKAVTAAILRGAGRVFEDFHYVREINGADGRDHAFVFKATVDGREVHGCDFLHFDEDGLIDEFTVMVRPLSGAQALAAAMGAQFERITAEARGAAGA
ncbi:SnoaL-like domain-containing protein OS=Kitasatospora aureofaciens OX=1894 GN=HS99_0003150 PE=4 SV=1 [Kitasatospora aureofaciens]